MALSTLVIDYLHLSRTVSQIIRWLGEVYMSHGKMSLSLQSILDDSRTGLGKKARKEKNGLTCNSDQVYRVLMEGSDGHIGQVSWRPGK